MSDDTTYREQRVRRALAKHGQALRKRRAHADVRVGREYDVYDRDRNLIVPGGEGITLEQAEDFAGLRR